MQETPYRKTDNNRVADKTKTDFSLRDTLLNSTVLNFLLILAIIEIAVFCLIKLTGILVVALPVTLAAFVAYIIYILVKRPNNIPKSNLLKYFASVLFWIFIITLIAGIFMPWIFWTLAGIALIAVIAWAVKRK